MIRRHPFFMDPRFASVGFGPAPATPIRPVNGGNNSAWRTNGWRSEGRRGKPKTGKIGGLWVQIAYALIDVCCVVGNGLLTFVFRFVPSGMRHMVLSKHPVIATDQPIQQYGAFLLLYVALIVLLCQWQDLYRTPRTRSAADESLGVVKAVFFATLLLTAFIYLSGVKIVSRIVVLASLLANSATMVAWRYAKRRIVIHRVEQGIGARTAVIIGAGRVGQALASELETNKLLGYRFAGFLDANHVGDPRILGRVDDLPRIVRVQFVDDVFITIPSERELVKRIAAEAHLHRVDVKVVPDLFDGLAWNAPLQHIGEFPVMDVCRKPIPTFGLFVKRVLDFSVAAIALILTLPFLLFAAVQIKLDSPGPVFYCSRRVGKKGRSFTFYKFRTMVANADALKDELRSRNEREGPCFKIADDPRITRMGRFLRRYSIDELPQLWNVVKGDMSLVGPRPHPLDDYAQYSLEDLRRLEVKPGITGLWQVTARQDPSFETNIRLDLEYIEHWNLWLDFSLLLQTLPQVLQGAGR